MDDNQEYLGNYLISESYTIDEIYLSVPNILVLNINSGYIMIFLKNNISK